SNAISVVSEIDVPANRPKGRSVATTIMKISVSAASRMFSAISFGVLRRCAAGDRRLVHSGDALDHGAVAGDQLTGRHDHDVAARQLRRGPGRAVAHFRDGLLAHRTQRVSLSAAAPLGE